MVFYLCAKESSQLSGLGTPWLDVVRSKLACVALTFREYLITEDVEQRRVFLKVVIYDSNDNEQGRCIGNIYIKLSQIPRRFLYSVS